MAEINPPPYISGECYTALDHRLIWDTLICTPGVKDAGGVGTDLRVGSVTSQPLTVLVAAGSAFIAGDVVANQGTYHVFSDSSVLLGIDAPDATDARVDLVVARIYDYFGTERRWALEVITGEPSPAPGPSDLPPNALALAEVRVEPGTVNTSPGMITDLRVQFQVCQPPQPIIQSGSVLISAIDGIGSATVTFPTPFPGIPNVVTSPTSNSAAVVPSSTVSGITTTGVGLYLRRGNETETRVHWIAVYQP